MNALGRGLFLASAGFLTIASPSMAAGWAGSTDFENALWGSFFTAGSGGSTPFSGGNPGRYGQSRPLIAAGTPGTIGRGFAGFNSSLTLFGTQVSFSHVVISADVRVSETAPHLAAQFVPTLLQNARIFAPLEGYSLTQTSWGFTGTLIFPLSDFVSSTETFDPLGTFTPGAAVKITGDAGLTPRSGIYDIDNVSIQLVPTPGVLGLAGCAGLIALRRRR